MLSFFLISWIILFHLHNTSKRLVLVSLVLDEKTGAQNMYYLLVSLIVRLLELTNNCVHYQINKKGEIQAHEELTQEA